MFQLSFKSDRNLGDRKVVLVSSVSLGKFPMKTTALSYQWVTFHQWRLFGISFCSFILFTKQLFCSQDK